MESYLLAAYAYCNLNDPGYMAGFITPMVATALMTMAVLLALFYMAAALFRKPEYESFVSIELHQLLVSALLFVFVLGSTCAASEYADRFAGNGDIFEVGRTYLNFISGSVALPSVISLEILKLHSQFWGSWTMRWGASVWWVILPGFPSFIVIERVADFLLLLISPFTASLLVQMAILEVIRGLVLPFVLPAGLVLRIFPPTRDAGGFLIASSIGFGIVYPYTYVMHDSVVRAMLAHDQRGVNVIAGLQGDYPDMAAYISLSGLFDADSMLFQPLRLLSFLLLQALFLPALSMTLTIAFIKGTAKFMSQKLS